MSEKCRICFQDVDTNISIYSYFKETDIICGICRKKFKEGFSVNNHGLAIEGLYEYDEEIENLLFTFKEGRDIALAPIFLYKHRQYLQKKYRKYTIVFAPSSREKIDERGFETLPLLYEEIKKEKASIFEKIGSYKQNLQPFDKRKQVKKHIRMINNIEDSFILLVDDVCTSGETLQVMYEYLKADDRKIKALVIAIHPSMKKNAN